MNRQKRVEIDWKLIYGKKDRQIDRLLIGWNGKIVKQIDRQQKILERKIDSWKDR